MLSDIIKLAIEENKKNKELYKKVRESYDKLEWLENFCTIHIDIGRGSGKTEYIKNNLTEKDVLICHSFNTRSEILNNNKNLKIFCSEFELKGISIYNIEYVYIDEPSMIFEHINQYKIYNIFSGEPTFILLGA